MAITQSEIVSQINRFAIYGMGIGEPPDIAKLKDLSLQDMLDAVRQVERDNVPAFQGGGGEFQVVPDDRLTAAVYTFLHYCVPPYHDRDDLDDAIVHLRIGNTRHGLIKWAREV